MEGTPDYLAQIVAQRAIADSARAELERRIVAARDAGVPLRRIAEAADMSHEYVRKLNPTERGNT